MPGWKDFSSNYFTFSRKERIGVIVVIVVIMGVFLLPHVVPKQTTVPINPDDSARIADVIRRENEQQPDKKSSNYEHSRSSYPPQKKYYPYEKRAATQIASLFEFDPNSLSKDGWKKLGLRDRTIQTIENFVSKGGKFRTPEDLKKIYGLFPDEYERLAPFVKIDDRNYVSTQKAESPSSYQPKLFPKQEYPPHPFDINEADTTAFIALPGIGSKLAARIIAFRDKLGGFYSVDQVAETFGLADSTFQKIKPYLLVTGSAVKRININKATIDELKQHPYIRYGIANPLVAYRNAHGLFAKIEDIKNVMAITSEIYNKLFPYLDM